MRKAIKAMLDYHMVYMIEGWQDSRGAMIEYRLAKELGIRVMMEGEWG